MANSKYGYVRGYELDDTCLPGCWMVCRIDGKAFHKFSAAHNFKKPNDKPALDLMTAAAKTVMDNFTDIVVSYGQSDEYSFVFRKETQLYGRRRAKIETNVVSIFAASYVMKWPEFFGETKCQYPPAFDARIVLYPNDQVLRDYLSWRQVDCHINNLYNTVFWALVQQGGLSNHDAQERLKGTFANDKNEILFSEFGVNYNKESEQFRKGTTLYRKKVELPVIDIGIGAGDNQVTTNEGDEGNQKANSKCKQVKTKVRTVIEETTCDIIQDEFWDKNPNLLNKTS